MSDTASDSFVLIQSDSESDNLPEFDHNMDEEGVVEEEEEEEELSESFDQTQLGHVDKDVQARKPLQRHGVDCKLCLEEIRGERWLCLECIDWSLCKTCFHSISNQVHPLHTFVCAHSVQDIFTPATSKIIGSSTPVIHMDVVCSSCQCPILGARYECIADECQRKVNLCQECESLPLQSHKRSHPMVKYRVSKERIAPSSLLKYDDEHEEKKRKAFELHNQPKQIGNKGYWELSKTAVVNESTINLRNLQAMNIVKDKETPWGSHLPPNTSFERSWDIKNTGNRPWPKGTSITRISSAVFSPPYFRKRMVSDSVVRVGETLEVRFFGLTTPEAPCTYLEVWALSDCEDRLFGERLEIRITVDQAEDKHASDRYHGLREALKDIKEGKEDLTREIDGVGVGETCKMRVILSTLEWQKEQQEFSCSWQIENAGKIDFPQGCQLRRIKRTVGANLTIDDTQAIIKVPQGLQPHSDATIHVNRLRIIPSANDGQNQLVMGEKAKKDKTTYFTETWIMVDGEGVEFGEKLHFAQSFQCSDIIDGKVTSLDVIGTWKGKGNWLYKSSIDTRSEEETI